MNVEATINAILAMGSDPFPVIPPTPTPPSTRPIIPMSSSPPSSPFSFAAPRNIIPSAPPINIDDEDDHLPLRRQGGIVNHPSLQQDVDRFAPILYASFALFFPILLSLYLILFGFSISDLSV
jgi:hypothetical protein